MKPNNPAVAMAAIARSHDKLWLLQFREQMVTDKAANFVTAITERLGQIEEQAFQNAIARSPTGQTLVARVHESLHVSEQFLAHNPKAKRLKLTPTRELIEQRGEKEALIRTVQAANATAGLELLAKYDRLDCAYEQIILDFPHEFDAATIAKARANLAAVPAPSPTEAAAA